MFAAFQYIVSMLPLVIFLGLYSVPAGLTFGAAKNHFKRNGEKVKSSDDIFWVSAICGAFFWITVPWFLFSRATTAVDPEIRAQKRALEAERLAEMKTREAKAQTKLERALFEEELARRARERAQGVDLPYIESELLQIETAKVNIEKERTEEIVRQTKALEQQASAQRSLTRGY